MNPAPSSTLEFRLLGTPEVRQNGKLITGITSAKAQALLYYLAMTAPKGHPVLPRAVLASLLWGERGEEDALLGGRELRGHADAAVRAA